MGDGARDLLVDGTVVAELHDGTDLPPEHAPRPYLHPVRTLGGTVLTAVAPVDHPWHAGVSVAIPDVDGRNCWGGPTYEHGTGYRWREDHGRVEVLRTTLPVRAPHPVLRATQPVLGATHPADGLDQELAWRGPDGAVLLHEQRTLGVAATADGWTGTWTTALVAPGHAPVTLGSPGSHGRAGAGYGGLTWRFPPCEDVHVRTATSSDEAAVHGSRTPWVEWSARFDGRPATVRLEALGHDDPWFVRVAEYPALGSALAWEAPQTVWPGTPLVRSFRVTVADGRPTSLAP